LSGPDYQFNLAAYGVNGVNYVIVISVYKPVGIFNGKEGLHRLYPGGGINIKDSVPHDFHLGQAYRPVSGMNLAVQVGQAYAVMVNQHQSAHSRPGQAFDGIASHPADAKNRHGAPGKRVQGFLTNEQFGSRELV
jgi:hypothetical protein